MKSQIIIPLNQEQYLITDVKYADFYSYGLKLLQSGANMPELIEVMTIFAAMPMYYSHRNNRYEFFEEQYNGSYIDKIKQFSDSENKKHFIEALHYLETNQLDLLLTSQYAKMSVKEKINNFYTYSKVVDKKEIFGIDNLITDTKKAQKICQEYSIGYEQDNNVNFSFQSLNFNCLFHNNECFVELYNHYEDKSHYIPLLLAYLKYTDFDLYHEDELSEYFMSSLKEQTLHRATEIYHLDKHLEGLMKKDKWQAIIPYLESSLEKEQLEKVISSLESITEKKKIKI